MKIYFELQKQFICIKFYRESTNWERKALENEIQKPSLFSWMTLREDFLYNTESLRVKSFNNNFTKILNPV